MNWINKLNEAAQVVPLGRGRLEVLNWSYAPHLPDNVPHRHTYFEICQVGAYGSGSFIVEGLPHRLEPFDLFLARPGVLHQIVNTAVPQMELYWVSFVWLPGVEEPVSELERWLGSFADAPRLVVPDEGEQLAALWRALRAVAGATPHPGHDKQLSGLMTALLLAIVDRGGAFKASQTAKTALPNPAARVRLAVRYIHDNLDRRLPVSEVAAQLNLSPRHLARLFADELGTSPAAYVEEARLERAQLLLQTGALPIKGVAAATGYDSVHHFSRAFSRRLGLAPGAFRERALREGSS